MKQTVSIPILGLSKAFIKKLWARANKPGWEVHVINRTKAADFFTCGALEHSQRWKPPPYRIRSRNLSMDKKTLRENISCEKKRSLSSVE